MARHGGVGRGFDETGFVAFAFEVTPAILALLRRLLVNEPEVEDLAAETICRAFVQWGRLAGYEYRRAWVLRVATNLAYDRSRAWARDMRRAAQQSTPTSAAQVEATVVDRILVVDAVANLSKRQREAVVLRHMADLSIAETAQAMGVAEGTARTHLDRGMAALRTALGEDTWEVDHADR